MLMTAMFVMYMIMTTISTMLMMVVMSVIVATTRPIRRMFVGMTAHRKQVHRCTSRTHRQRAGAHQAGFEKAEFFAHVKTSARLLLPIRFI